jgi:hypothetical protein
MMLEANGETRKYLGLAFGAALVGALGAELGKWAIERLRKAAKDPTPPPASTTGA